MLKTIRTNFDRNELRRDRRYALPPIKVLLDSGNFATTNWSLGGFLLPDGPALLRGVQVGGELVLPADSEIHAFTAEIVRRDSDGVGFRFVEPSSSLIGALDRVIAGRMFRKRV
jgi:hypothetical protein